MNPCSVRIEVFSLMALDDAFDAKTSCFFHVFTPLDLTVEWRKWDAGFRQVVEAFAES